MKIRFFSLSLVALISVHHAFAIPYDFDVNSLEDTSEFSQPVSDEERAIEANELKQDPAIVNDLAPLTTQTKNSLTVSGNWAFKFVFLRKDGSTDVLSEYRSSSSVKPASTLKLFTGWMGFLEKAKPIRYLSHMLQHSNNGQANDTLKVLGGTQKLVQFYKDQSLSSVSQDFKPVDGCGLSHSNRVTVDLEIELLQSIHANAKYNEFKELLAQPGEEGTLSKRLKNVAEPIFGKTGTLCDTAGLAGFVDFPSGTLIFSVIGNQLPYSPNKNGGCYKAGVLQSRPQIDEVLRNHIDYVQANYDQVVPSIDNLH